MPREYHPYEEKHKRPKGFGTLCPAEMTIDEAAQLLAVAVAVQGVGANKLWMASGRWCFCAHPSPGIGPEAWHGFPVIGGEVDERVWRVLHNEGFLTRGEVNRLRRQRELPESWP